MEHIATEHLHDRTDRRVELRKRIIKLRWIGREDDAERLCARLSEIAPDEVLAGETVNTD